MKTLLLWLEGPLQSWGHDSQFDRRDTLPFPTFSGICGMLCAALGAGGPQTELLSRLSKAKWECQSFILDKKTPSPMLVDFQGVGNGYDGKDPWENLFIPKTDEGKKLLRETPLRRQRKVRTSFCRLTLSRNTSA